MNATQTAPERLTKAQAIEHWRNLEPTPLHMAPVLYKTQGSRYGYDGIRIDGSRRFIDSVLARLVDLLEQENGDTRLELNYTEIADRETRTPTGSWVCYVRAHERGREARLVNAMFGLTS